MPAGVMKTERDVQSQFGNVNMHKIYVTVKSHFLILQRNPECTCLLIIVKTTHRNK